jgi:hypothetical protein
MKPVLLAALVVSALLSMEISAESAWPGRQVGFKTGILGSKWRSELFCLNHFKIAVYFFHICTQCVFILTLFF